VTTGDGAQPVLYGYWRSSSSYRVRIALNLKGIAYRQEPVNLVRGDGDQQRPEYRAVNPLGLVPALVHAGRTVTQSIAICEYLEDVFPEPPLLPAGAAGRARVRTLVQTIACEIQPLNNLAVMRYLTAELEQSEDAVQRWYAHWVGRGFAAVESWLRDADTGRYCHGDRPTLADCFLVPQVYNAERFGCDLTPYPEIERVAGHCRAQDAFLRASPERQPDAAPAP
jgi:maleylacetoacetate isomerase